MIVFALYSLASSTDKGASGGNISNVALIKELARCHDVVVISPSISDNLRQNLNQAGVTVITRMFARSGILSRLARRRWIYDSLSAQFERSNNIRTIVSSNGTCDIAQKIVLRYRSALCQPRFLVLSRAYEDMFYSRRSGSVKTIIKGALFDSLSPGSVARAYRSADTIITNSRFMADEIGRYFSIDTGKVSVLYPPIPTGSGVWRAPPPKPRVGIVNPKPEKGGLLFSQLAQSRPDWSFVYFGPSDIGFSLPNITYGGWSSDPFDLYRRLDVMIVPSQWHEPFGRVAVEAISHGVPALVSNRGGLPETVDVRFVVDSDSCLSWSNAIVSLTENPDSAKDAWERSMRLADSFSMERHRAIVAEIFPN